MIKDFNLKVKSQLDSDEKIENSFKIRNESTLSGDIDMSESPALTANGVDFSFFYQFIITNKRVFIGNLNSYNQAISYEVYDRDDIKVSKDKRKEEKLSMSARIFCGICVLLPLLIAAVYLFNSNLKNNIAVCALLVIGAIMLIFLIRQVNKISNKIKLKATVCLKNNKKLYGIFNSENEISILKNL